MSRNTSKRNLSSSSIKDSEKKSKLFVSPNRYASLSEDADSSPEVFSPPPIKTSPQDQTNTPPVNMESSSTTKIHAPPFYVSEGYEFPTLKNDLFDILDPSSIQFKSTPNYLIIHAGTVIAWNTIFKYLADNEQFKFYTFLPKPLKPYSVFIRHLHPSTPVEDIQACITDKGHDVIQVTNILHRIKKCALPLFRVDLKPAINNKDILNLDSLLHTKIICELPKKKRTPPQCKSCQSYFHTSNFCHHTPRCVKCGDNHLSSECLKPPSIPAKCALCSGPHTASYKGCPVYKNISKNQKSLKAANLKKTPVQNITMPLSRSTPSNTNFKHNKSSYAFVTANTPPDDTPVSSINKFLDDFKAIINPLILLLTSVLNRLQPVSLP